MKKNQINSLGLILIFACFVLACNFSFKPQYYKDDIKLAEPEVEKVIDLLKEKKVSELYDLFHEDIKNTLSKEELEEFFANITDKYGDFKKKKFLRNKVRHYTVRERVVHFIYEAEFSKADDILHIAIITNDDKKTKLFGINMYDKTGLDELIKELERN